MKNLANAFKILTREKIIFLGSILIFGILLARNPYSVRTLIPNLEPYPDTFHYIIPALSLVKGGPFKIVREGRSLNPSVPPLYSLVLVPFLAINQDPRTFYFANIFLSILSIGLLYLIVRKISDDKFVLGIILFLFSTNYFMYWYPQFAMAENLILPIFFWSVYLLIIPVEKKNMFFASLIPLLLYSTKYAYLPYSIAYVILYMAKIFIEYKSSPISFSIKFLIFSILFFIPIGIYQFYLQDVNPITRYLSILISLVSFGKQSINGITDTFASSAGWFSNLFFQKNFPLYLRGLLGEQTRFLWDFTPVLPKYIIYPAWIGLIFGIFKKRYRFISISLVILLLFHLFLIASFSTLDMRYIYHTIPTLLIGFAIFLVSVKDFLHKIKFHSIFIIILVGFSGLYFYNNVGRIKYQVALNLRHAETPWYYLSVISLNDYFSKDKISDGKFPIVISPMPPYYIDYFSNGNYKLLPLAQDQEFRLYKEVAWGPGDYSDLHKLYKSYLTAGEQLYVATYGLGNEYYLHSAYESLSKDFKLMEVKSDCYNECNIYKISLVNGKNN